MGDSPHLSAQHWQATAMETVVVTGIAGQDGTYLAESLIHDGVRVVGVVRDADLCRTKLPKGLVEKVALVEWDMIDEYRLRDVLEQYDPVAFFNLAAYSLGSGMFEDPAKLGEVNGIAVARILDGIRNIKPSIRFCQASSSEMFGSPDHSPQNERSAFRPRSPYGAAKLFAHTLVQTYRERFGLFACSAILYNHESPRRKLSFVTRKVTDGVARIKLGVATELLLGNMEARRDWGYAPDYVRGLRAMLTQAFPDDFVLATGETRSVRELCECAFSHVGLDYRDFVKINSDDYRSDELFQLVGDASKARHSLGWAPSIKFEGMIREMVDADLRALSRSEKNEE
jgi:GDPmannose 4,6-dehydratase